MLHKNSHDTSRLTLDIPSEDHRMLKTLASTFGKSMREIVSEWIHRNLKKYSIPNAATLRAIDSVESGKNLVQSENAEDMFKDLGI